jgi:UDP:flavonoid glycosyltransferase YjiC (YdhE family)
MAGKKILYISGSLGLGHITRDLAIARELRKQNPEVEITWLAAHPANVLLKETGEKILPEADMYADDNIPAENAAKGTQLNLLKYLSNARREWTHNVKIFKQATSREQFDLIIGDEAYEINIALRENPLLKKAPFVMIYDFVGLDAMTKNPFERLKVYFWNRIWSKHYKHGRPPAFDLGLFVGEEEDVPDRKFGFMLPNRRDFAKALYKFTGYIFPFDPAEYADKAKIRSKLGYGSEPLVVCSIGGTSIGKELLELCGRAFPIIREKIPDLRMVLVCGPRLSAKSLQVPNEVEIREYVPALYEHFAVSDLVIVQGGATSTLELTALRCPFLYFPLEGHCEQEVQVANRLTRYQAGVKMTYSQTSPESLAEQVISNIGKKVTYKPIPTDGAQKAAELINELLV